MYFKNSLRGATNIPLGVISLLFKIMCNKTLGRARDPRANGAWLNKLTEKHEVFVLGGQRIDQKSKKGWKRG